MIHRPVGRLPDHERDILQRCENRLGVGAERDGIGVVRAELDDDHVRLRDTGRHRFGDRDPRERCTPDLGVDGADPRGERC